MDVLVVYMDYAECVAVSSAASSPVACFLSLHAPSGECSTQSAEGTRMHAQPSPPCPPQDAAGYESVFNVKERVFVQQCSLRVPLCVSEWQRANFMSRRLTVYSSQLTKFTSFLLHTILFNTTPCSKHLTPAVGCN